MPVDFGSFDHQLFRSSAEGEEAGTLAYEASAASSGIPPRLSRSLDLAFTASATALRVSAPPVEGVHAVVVSPAELTEMQAVRALGDNYDEMVESLNRLADAWLHLAIAFLEERGKALA